jgi:dihydrodipicolinate synthase/N-acetylneuraminate lyase
MTREQIIAHLSGIHIPIVTPFNRRGDPDAAAFRSNLRAHLKLGLNGVLVAGSTGEGPLLTEKEKLRLVEWARPLVKPPRLLAVATGMETTRETIRVSREAIKRGADAILTIPPTYYKPRMDNAVLSAHFQTVADALTRPLLIYSIPQFTGINIEVKTIALLSRHGNIAGIKESSGKIDFVLDILSQVDPKFRLFVGSALILCEALAAGAAGTILGPLNYAPNIYLDIYESWRRGEREGAQKLQQRFIPLVQEVNIRCGIPGIKYAADLCGYKGGWPRSPLLPLMTADQRKVVAALRKARIPIKLAGAA